MAEPFQLNEADLEEIFERSSGPGGQNVNKTSTKVTLLHKPTGISVTIQDTRSQMQNRKLARERLGAAIREAKEKARRDKISAREALRRKNAPRPPRIKRAFVQKKRRDALKRQNRRVSSDD
jgi:protein subunit release factor B